MKCTKTQIIDQYSYMFIKKMSIEKQRELWILWNNCVLTNKVYKYKRD